MRDEELEQSHSTHAAAFAVAAEDQVIEHRQVDRLTRLRQGAGGAAIGHAWPRVAARVIMRQYDPGASNPRRLGDDRSHRQTDRSDLALEVFKMNALSRAIEMGDPQSFSLGVRFILETGGEETARGLMAIEQSRGFDTLIPHDNIATRLATAHLSQPHPFRTSKRINRAGRAARLG